MERRKITPPEPETGVCMFAYNNDEIDYARLAIIAALHVKANMKNSQVALITDTTTEGYLSSDTFDSELVDSVFDYIIIKNINYERNIRVHHDSPWYTFKAQFTNQNKHEIIDLSPFEKTLLIDTDFLICNSKLDAVFELDAPLSMWDHALNLEFRIAHPEEQRLRSTGINMWWSTAIYFDKSDFCQLFFDLWNHIRNNYDFYKFRYGFPGVLYRTDYAVSIAIHILNGMMNNDGLVQTLPGEFMRYMDQKDELVAIQDKNKLLFLINDRTENWKDIFAVVTEENIHAMNKKALLRNYRNFIEKLA